MMLDEDRAEYHAIVGDALERMIAKSHSTPPATENKKDAPHQFVGLWQQMVEMGISGLAIDEAHGGSGGSLTDAVLVMEQLGMGAAPSPFFGHWLASVTLAGMADGTAKEFWLPRLASGESVAAFGVVPAPSTDGADITVVSEWTAFGQFADLIVLLSPSGEIWLVEPQNPDVAIVRQDCIDSTRQACKVTAPARSSLPVDKELARRVIQAARMLLAAESWGSGKKMFEKTREHVLLRRQFGHALAEFQSIKHTLADISLSIDFSRPLLWKAALMWDQRDAKATDLDLLCKAHITESVLVIGRKCIELHGASGFLLEGDLHYWFNRARFCSVYMGTAPQLRKAIAEERGWNTL